MISVAACPECGHYALEPAKVDGFLYCTRCGRGSIPREHDLDCGQIHSHTTGPWRAAGEKLHVTCCSETCWCQPPLPLREIVENLTVWRDHLLAWWTAHQPNERDLEIARAALDRPDVMAEIQRLNADLTGRDRRDAAIAQHLYLHGCAHIEHLLPGVQYVKHVGVKQLPHPATEPPLAPTMPEILTEIKRLNAEQPPASPTLTQLQAEVRAWTIAKGWADDRTVGDLLMLMVCELAEAMEEHRDWREPYEIRVVAGKPEGIPIELADVVIRILSFCGKYDINLEDAVLRKMAYNATREHRHGGKRA